jgi:DNA-binding CsgD family transcriptional regulator
MRAIVCFLVLLTGYCTPLFSQPAQYLHKPYSERSRFLDSLFWAVENKSPAETKAILTNVEKWANDNGDKELGGEILLIGYRKRIFPEAGKDQPDVEKLQELALFANKNKYGYLEAKTIQSIGDYYGMLKKNGLAFENYLAAYGVYSKFTGEEFPDKQAFLFSLASSYYSYDDIDNTIKYLQMALFTKSRDNRVLNTINNTLGLCYRKLKQYDSSEWYFRKVYENAVQKNDSAWIGIAAGNIGINYFHQKRYDDAIPLLEKDISFSMATHQLREVAGSMGILATIYYDKKDYDKSEKLLNQAVSLVEPKSFWPYYPLAEQLYTQLYKTYAAKNDMRKAYLYADSALVAKDSLVSQFNAITLSKAKEKAELAQHTLEVEKLANQHRMQTLIRDSLVAGILLITIIGILFINRQRLKQKKLEAEKRNAESELNSAAMKLDDFRQSIQEKNKIIEHFTEEVQKLKKGEEHETDPELLAQLERAVILTDEQWENFRITFEKVHKGFFSSLKKKMPDLTQAEIRFLALTKLKLTSKEMAAMLGISMNAIRMYRHRLRRKFELDKENMIEELVEDI